jgi:lipopolysaccharide export system protein LptA
MPRLFSALLILTLMAAPSLAQQADVRFGGLRQDTSLPVEVDADQLSVDQADGRAIFSGNVTVKQGDMRLTAGRIEVEYTEGNTGIARLVASGGVTLVSPQDAAEAREAIYTIDSGVVVMTGDVLLTQGNAAISGESLTVNLKDGTGTMAGRVRTIFSPGTGNSP